MTRNDGHARNYAYDPELAAALALIPAISIEDVEAARVEAGALRAERAGVPPLARARPAPPPSFQMRNQPVLDDRLQTASMKRFVDTPVWHATSAALSWRYYLGESPDEAPYYAAPLRADDLSGLPP